MPLASNEGNDPTYSFLFRVYSPGGKVPESPGRVQQDAYKWDSSVVACVRASEGFRELGLAGSGALRVSVQRRRPGGPTVVLVGGGDAYRANFAVTWPLACRADQLLGMDGFLQDLQGAHCGVGQLKRLHCLSTRSTGTVEPSNRPTLITQTPLPGQRCGSSSNPRTPTKSTSNSPNVSGNGFRQGSNRRHLIEHHQ